MSSPHRIPPRRLPVATSPPHSAQLPPALERYAPADSPLSHCARARSKRIVIALACATVAVLSPTRARAQQSAPTASDDSQVRMSLAEAQAAARSTSPELRAAREAVAAARARERQASAFLNPTLTYGREVTSRTGQSNAQDIAQLAQPLEVGGQRRARRDAARLRGEVAEARLQLAEHALQFDVARAFANVAAAVRRAALADEAAAAFAEAGRVTAQRLAAGDVAGYASRRLQLESARYAALRADAVLALRVARIELSTLTSFADDSARPIAVVPIETTPSAPSAPLPSLDSLRMVALSSRADLRALRIEAAAMAADARLAVADRVPTPSLAAGYKRESVDDVGGGGALNLHGFVAGFSLPLAMFDRRRGTVDASSADSRQRAADVDALRRRVRRDVDEAYASLGAVSAQLDLLRPQLGESARTALHAVHVAYAEGEISLLEWLDAVRAYQEAESTYVTLQADAIVRRAALERAVGHPLFSGTAR